MGDRLGTPGAVGFFLHMPTFLFITHTHTHTHTQTDTDTHTHTHTHKRVMLFEATTSSRPPRSASGMSMMFAILHLRSLYARGPAWYQETILI